MKKKLTLLLLTFAFMATGLYAQNCTPVSFGQPTIQPPTEDLDCVERGQPYSETVYIQNFDEVTLSGFTATVNFLRIDSIINLPCGLDYQVNTSQSTNSNTIAGGDSACISIYGTSHDFPGQYRILLYITVEVVVSGFPQQFQGEATDLIDQIEATAGQSLGLDFNYWLRVRETAAPCPAIDTLDATAWNLTASDPCPNPSDFVVQALSRTSEICGGDSVELYATAAGGTLPYTYSWDPDSSLIDANTQAPIAVPTVTTNYTVTADDGSTTATSDVEITIIPEPTAGFSFVVDSNQVTFTNNSTNATSYSWDYGDNTSGAASDPVKTYINAGTYDVILTATNNCGSDADTQSVTIVSQAFCTLSATCSAQSPTGNLGLSPDTDNINCVNRGDFYQQYLYLEVPAQITIQNLGITAEIDFLRIDNIENLPCGIAYRFDDPSQLYNGGTTGCLELYGTTIDPVGQYKLLLYITISISVPAFGIQGEEFSGRADELLQQIEDQLGSSLGIDFEYWLRVKNAGTTTCPAVDRSGNNDLTASCDVLEAAFTGSSCDGANGTLTGFGAGGYPPYTFDWDNGAMDSSIVVGPDSVVLLRVVDSLGNTVCSEAQLMPLTDPVADFESSLGEELTVTFDDASAEAITSYSWDFGDGNTSTEANPQHQYAAEGTYTVELTVTNDCGTHTVEKEVEVVPVGINDFNADFSISVIPNPNDGLFYLNIKTEKRENGVLSAYDMSGKVVYRENLDIINVRKAIDLNGVSQGVYILELRTESSRVIEKLVIK
ncbi:MAG: PKD domain-containing protein [Chitinophagales bacterium]